MTNEFLEIVKYSDTGSGERTIICLVGRVNVFRSSNPTDLEQYQKALFGEETKQRFSIMLDTSRFEPEKHNLLDLDTASLSGVKLTVREYLLFAGAKEASVDNLLVRCGLAGLADSTCESLTARQAHTVQILKASFEPEKVMIVKEPFENLGVEAHDGLGTEIVKFAWEKSGFVLITSLRQRPESWLGNPHIQRVSVDRPRAVTIGVAGPTSEELRKRGSGQLQQETGADNLVRDVEQSAYEQGGPTSSLRSNATSKSVFAQNMSLLVLGIIILGLCVSWVVVEVGGSGGESVTQPANQVAGAEHTKRISFTSDYQFVEGAENIIR